MEKRKKIWCCLLFAALVAYTIKNIFVGADVDEGYGIMAGYRLAAGDKLLLEMWEPHQTSAIFTALLIRPFLWLTGGNEFLNIYLRMMYFLVQGLIAVYLCRTLRSCLPWMEREIAVLLSMGFYLITPKCICIPEYSNLHIWFFTLLCIQLIRYYAPESLRRGKIYCLALAGIFLACDVLAYPSMALLFPVCVIFILWKHVQARWKEVFSFAAPCVLGAITFIAYLLSYMTPELILQILPYILGEESHQADVGAKLTIWVMDFGYMAVVLLIGGAVSWGLLILWHRISRKETQADPKELYMFLFYLVQLVYQLYCWFTNIYNAAYPQIVLVAICLMGIYCYFRSGRREKTGFYLILFTGINYFAVLLMSNWGPANLNSYLIMGVIGGFLCWYRCYGVENRGGHRLLTTACAVFVLINAVAYSYFIIGDDAVNPSILDVRGINHEGVRKGILTSYMTAYRYNVNQEIWEEAVPDGSTVLYVGQSQFYYMLGDCTIASPNTISTPSYDESMLAYWELNPDRYPDVVAVESWFGDIRIIAEDSFLAGWLETDFQASRIVDYPYITVYYK
ncbi:MAG: hypothetical protein J1E64_09285 [Acetatifactor sp.]|nr:hypothetical protein [Acetatifactor sp.]